MTSIVSSINLKNEDLLMCFLYVLYPLWMLLANLLPGPLPHSLDELKGNSNLEKYQVVWSAPALTCDCSITQGGTSYPISALMGTVSGSSFYSYGIPSGSSANTGLEESNGLILFLYEDINTGIISLFLIADIANSGSGGSLTFDVNCLPQTAFISVQDDAGEFSGSPPLVTGNWSWGDCCTDGGVIEDIGCNNTINLDLLVASGIDSIVWLTGDITNPDHILLSLSGEAITISCGSGGVCCPVGFDTGITIMDATCTDSQNGSISLVPQDGIAPYSYDWSNGGTAATNTGLMPGTYMVTVTDSQGCSEELSMVVDVSPGDPPGNPADIELCSENAQDFFDLTSVNDIVNIGSGLNVLWFQNADMSGSIGNPTAYLSGSATVYAFVDNGSCLSDPVPVNLILQQSPIAIETSMSMCEESNEMSTFDLTTMDAVISGGNGTVNWYEDPGLTNEIADPTAFSTGTTIVYATVSDGTCTSQPVSIDLLVYLKPIGYTADMHLCGNDIDEAVFDLTQLDAAVSAGNGGVNWYLEMDLFDPILNPNSFLTASTIVYAFVFDGICYSDPIPVTLIVDPTPIGIPVSIDGCDDGSGQALFNLWDYAVQVSGGAGGVDWYLDEFLSEPVLNPGAFITEATVIFATVDNGMCTSDAVQIQLNVLQSPVGNPTSLSTCADTTGQGVFNLTLADLEVSGGVGVVQWYEDAMGQFLIAAPTAYVTSGTIVYAQIGLGACLSSFIPVNLIIVNSVMANPAQYQACDDGTGSAIFNLLNVENVISGGTGQVSWFIDSMGLILLPTPSAFQSGDTTVYAYVSAGTCVSDIVPVELMVLPSPVASDLSFSICGDSAQQATVNLGMHDTMISGNTDTVLWFLDSLLTLSIGNPGAFLCSDTVVYAAVSNGICLSPFAVVNIAISAGLEASPVSLGYCIPQGDTILVDLTQSDTSISGGTGTVHWFTDSLGVIEIISPDSFPATSSITLYADVSDSVCTSAIVPVQMTILASPESHGVDIKKCADFNGVATVDLTSVDALVSAGSGIISWYTDTALSLLVVNPDSLVTGDTTVYALVTNGFCISPVVPVTVTVVDSLIASPLHLELCLLDSDTALIDLTQYDPNISGGSGPVYWFTDNQALDTLSNPSIFKTTGDTLYAVVAADGCISNIASISIDVASSSFPLPTCAYTSIDSVSISWLSTTDQYLLSYSINGQPVFGPFSTPLTSYGVGSLNQGDTLDFTLTALYDSICTMPLTSTLSCITDVCPAQAFSFSGLDTVYCKDQAFVLLQPFPFGGQFSGQGISGDTLYPNRINGNGTDLTYVWQELGSGCKYDSSIHINVYDPLAMPVLSCASVSIDSVSFQWNALSNQYGYTYSINGGSSSSVVITGDTSLLIIGLNEGDIVKLALWAIGPPPCDNSDTITESCMAKLCPAATVQVTDPGLICSEDDPFQLQVIVNGLSPNPFITWTGTGISNSSGVFDPRLASPGSQAVQVIIEDQGCFYNSSLNIQVLPQPKPILDLSGDPCINSPLHIQFKGTASAAAQFDWNLDGGQIVSGSLPLDFSIQWPDSGRYKLELVIDDQGCISDATGIDFQIDSPLDTPKIVCLQEDYTSLAVEWEPVPGATSYNVTSSAGSGLLSGNTYAITNLQDDKAVRITVEAIGVSACGPSSATMECHTLAYIPVLVYLPNVFSPNKDAINDIFFLQCNPEVTEVTALRIFDRWGNAVFGDFNFLPNDPQHGWDGTFKGKVMNPAVYTYYAEVQTTRGRPLVVVGEVTLVR